MRTDATLVVASSGSHTGMRTDVPSSSRSVPNDECVTTIASAAGSEEAARRGAGLALTLPAHPGGQEPGPASSRCMVSGEKAGTQTAMYSAPSDVGLL